MWNKQKVLKILMIGNSFSQDTVEHMPEMAKSLGFSDYVVGNLVIGGCSINTHYNHSKSGAKAYGFLDSALRILLPSHLSDTLLLDAEAQVSEHCFAGNEPSVLFLG